jgi:hypothetical protein
VSVEIRCVVERSVEEATVGIAAFDVGENCYVWQLAGAFDNPWAGAGGGPSRLQDQGNGTSPSINVWLTHTCRVLRVRNERLEAGDRNGPARPAEPPRALSTSRAVGLSARSDDHVCMARIQRIGSTLALYGRMSRCCSKERTRRHRDRDG